MEAGGFEKCGRVGHAGELGRGIIEPPALEKSLSAQVAKCIGVAEIRRIEQCQGIGTEIIIEKITDKAEFLSNAIAAE